MTFDYYYEQGARAAEEQKYKEAIEHFLQAIRVSPSQPETYFSLGDAYEKIGNYHKAMESYMQGVRLKHSVVGTKVDFSAIGGPASGRSDLILPEGQKIQTGTNPFSSAQSGLETITPKDEENLAGRSAPAAEHLVVDEDQAEAYFHLGIAFGKIGELTKALESFQKALYIHQDYAEVYFAMGIVYHELGDISNKIASYREAVHFDPGHPEAHYNLGISYLDIDVPAKALEEYEILKYLKPPLAQNLLKLIGRYEKKSRSSSPDIGGQDVSPVFGTASEERNPK
jgi:tetratricopeptide (TPR) repeat protein